MVSCANPVCSFQYTRSVDLNVHYVQCLSLRKTKPEYCPDCKCHLGGVYTPKQAKVIRSTANVVAVEEGVFSVKYHQGFRFVLIKSRLPHMDIGSYIGAWLSQEMTLLLASDPLLHVWPTDNCQ